MLRQAPSTLAPDVLALAPDASRIAEVSQYRAVLAASRHDKEPVACAACKAERTAVGHCAACGFVCAECEESHKTMRVFESHVVRPLSEVAVPAAAAPQLEVYCQQDPGHSREPARMYCEACHNAVCAACCLTHHRDHASLDTTTCSEDLRRRVRAAHAAVGFGDHEAKVRDGWAAADAEQARAQRAHDETSGKISAVRAEVLRVANAHCDALQALADALLARQQAALQEQASRVASTVARVVHTLRKAYEIARGAPIAVGALHGVALQALGAARAAYKTMAAATPVSVGPGTLRLPAPGAVARFMQEQLVFEDGPKATSALAHSAAPSSLSRGAAAAAGGGGSGRGARGGSSGGATGHGMGGGGRGGGGGGGGGAGAHGE